MLRRLDIGCVRSRKVTFPVRVSGGKKKFCTFCVLNVPPILYTPSCDNFEGYLTTLPVTISVINE